MVLIKANADSENGVLPKSDYIGKMMEFNEMLVNKGIMLAGDGLHPSSRAKRVRFEAGKKPVVIDGPFAETKELLAGFWIWKVDSMDEAVALVKQIPEPDISASPASAKSEIELRPLFDMEEFGENVTPEIRAKANELDAKITGRG
jgi:hypothetical protein